MLLDVPLDRRQKSGNLPHIYRMHEALSLSEASRRSGINRRTLQRWIREGLVTTNERGLITLESVESAAARPKKAGRPAGQNLPSEAEWMRLLNRENRPDVLAKIVEKLTRKHHEELVKCLPIEQRAEAMEGLYNPLTQEPLRPGAAKIYIENTFQKPEGQRREWQQMRPRLAKKYPGAVIVEWDKRADFVVGATMAAEGFARCDQDIDTDKLLNPSRTLSWGELASSMRAPVYIAPAMTTPDKHLALVKKAQVRDGDTISPSPKLKHRRKASQ